MEGPVPSPEVPRPLALSPRSCLLPKLLYPTPHPVSLPFPSSSFICTDSLTDPVPLPLAFQIEAETPSNYEPPVQEP